MQEWCGRARVVWTQEHETSLWQEGYARTGPLLTPAECEKVSALYAQPRHFRSRIEMARYRFGIGDYQYFDYPLPPLIAKLRGRIYPRLPSVANAGAEALGSAERYPDTLEEMLRRCHAAGQQRATPLILHYEAGGYNCLHQDLYGEIAFPMQVVVMLSRPGRDFTGGEFLLVEQQPRAQSVGRVIQPEQGEGVIFTTRDRPVKGGRGYYRARVRHGVSQVRTGTRYTLGLIFHDAK